MERAIRAKGLLNNADINDEDDAVIRENCGREFAKAAGNCKNMQSFLQKRASTLMSIKLLSSINESYGFADVLDKLQLLQLFVPQKIAFDKEYFEIVPAEAAYIVYGLRGKFNSFTLENIHIAYQAKQ